jgi:protein SCO1
MNTRRNAIKSVAAYALFTGATGFITSCSQEQKLQFKSIDLTGADYAKGFALTDHNGQLRTLKDFAGKIVVVFFGFTQCPDVCPTSMAELASIKQMLGADGSRLQGIFISVDPERDTLEVLKAYMVNFDPTFLALRPTPEQLPGVAKDFKVYYKKVEGRTATSYNMDHSAGSYVFDTRGNLRLYSRYGTGIDGLIGDIRQLLKTA